MTEIIDIHPIDGEIVLTERVATNEFFITAIHEFIKDKIVRVEVEMGPFITDQMPNGNTFTRGTSQRMVVAWEGSEYESIMNTWDNAALIAKVSEILSAQAQAQAAQIAAVPVV